MNGLQIQRTSNYDDERNVIYFLKRENIIKVRLVLMK